VIFLARYEASQSGSELIEPEHLLLGIIREDRNIVSRFFPKAVWVDQVRKDIEGRVLVRNDRETPIHLPLSAAAKSVLELAAEESERLHHRYIGTEHLLLGLLREDRTIAAELLYEYGVRLDAVRTALQNTEGTTDQREPSNSTGMFEGIFRLEQMGRLFGILGNRGVVSMEEVGNETNRLRRSPAFQALLNVLAKFFLDFHGSRQKSNYVFWFILSTNIRL